MSNPDPANAGHASRGRGLLHLVIAAAWLVVVYFLADKSAHGFSRGEIFPLIRNLFQIFLLIVGFGYMELALDNSREPLRAMGLVPRQGAAREFALGAAIGWGMVAIVMLAIAIFGHLYVQIWWSAHSVLLLILQLAILASATLAAEIAFRGYPFQKLIQATGPFSGTILAGILFALLRKETPGAGSVAVWVSGLAAVLLSVAYLRTRGLWLCWGVHFAWLASLAVLFGQPLAGDRQSSTVILTYTNGPSWLTGGEYGPEGSVIAFLVLLAGLHVLVRATRDLASRYSQPELKPAGFAMHPPQAMSFASSSPTARPQSIPIAPPAPEPELPPRAEDLLHRRPAGENPEIGPKNPGADVPERR